MGNCEHVDVIATITDQGSDTTSTHCVDNSRSPMRKRGQYLGLGLAIAARAAQRRHTDFEFETTSRRHEFARASCSMERTTSAYRTSRPITARLRRASYPHK